VQARRRTCSGRVRRAVDGRARHSVLRPDIAAGARNDQAAGRAGPGRILIPTDRHRGSSGSACGAGAGTPAGLVPDLAGPRVYQTAEPIGGYLRVLLWSNSPRHSPLRDTINGSSSHSYLAIILLKYTTH